MSKTHKELQKEFREDLAHHDAYNKCMEIVIDSIARPKETRGDGGSTHYYSLPEGATELRHLIRHKKMAHGVGEAFCALYRLNDNGETLRNLEKAKFYIECEIEYYKKENNVM